MEFPVAPTANPIAFAQVSCIVQLAALQAEVEALLSYSSASGATTNSAWVDHVNKNDYRGGWDVLPLRCQRQYLTSHPILQGFAIAKGDEWENLPALALCPQIRNLFSQLQCPIKAARLMRLKAGA